LPFPDTLFQPSLASPTPSPSVSTSGSSRGRSKSPIHSSPSVLASREGYRTPGLGPDYPMYTSELSQPLFLPDSFEKSFQAESDSFLTGDFNPMFALPNTSYSVDPSSSHGVGTYPPAIAGETRFPGYPGCELTYQSSRARHNAAGSRPRQPFHVGWGPSRVPVRRFLIHACPYHSFWHAAGLLGMPICLIPSTRNRERIIQSSPPFIIYP
jgi:hypothetical protein